MVIGDAKNKSVRGQMTLSEKHVKDKRSSLTTKTPQPQTGVDDSMYEDNFIFEYTERDGELKDWLYTNLPVAKILSGFRGDADLVIINGDSPRPYQIVQEVLDEHDQKARFTIGIAGTVIIQIKGGGHSTVTVLGARMRSTALKDLAHRNDEEKQVEPHDIEGCIQAKGDGYTQLSSNVDQTKKIVEENLHSNVPKWLTKRMNEKKAEKKKEEEKGSFTKSPDFSFCPRYRFMWSQFKKRQPVNSVFGEVSSSDSTGKGAFDALLFVGGNKLQTDLSVNADLKLGRIKDKKRLKSMTVNMFDMTAGRLLEISDSMGIDDEDRRVLRSAAKLKAQEQLEALRLLRRVINLDKITPVTLHTVCSELFGDSDFPLEIYDDRTLWSAERCAKLYGKLSRTVNNTIAYYEGIRIQVSDADNVEADEMEERILRLVATHSSAATVSVKEDGRLEVDPPEGISFPTLSFSGLLTSGGGRSELSADTLCEAFEDASESMSNNLAKTVPSSELGTKDFDSEGWEACAKAMFPKVKNPEKQLKSLFDLKRKRKPRQVELKYLTKDALIRIGRKHHKVPPDVSESLALAYAVDSIWEGRKQKEERVRDVKRMRSSTSGTGETGHAEQSDSIGSSGTRTELPEQGPTTVSEVLENMPISIRRRSERIRQLLSNQALQRSIEQDTIALRGLERLLQENFILIEGILSVPDNVLQFLHAKGNQ